MLCATIGSLFASDGEGSRPTLVIPRLAEAPHLEDFLGMGPGSATARQMRKVTSFIQREPHDGEPASQETEAYLGYDDENLYAVFVCFDREPGKIRARRSRRENVFGDDTVEVILDTFHDQRRAYAFITNAFGIQWDAIWREGSGFDESFDTVWHSRGKLTERGYVVWVAIPFRSLRFDSQPQQTWGLLLNRQIPRNNEDTFWPHYSIRIEGRLNQAAVMEGLEGISPGRNMQFIPYGVFRSFRALDATRQCLGGICGPTPVTPAFATSDADVDGGLDAKLVFLDKLVLDLTGNPDFSQVESDEPQVTVNERFEVFFPEKRPFFLENASFFETPIDLFFTRRIADPQFGARLTGKVGAYALGFLFADDQAPGKAVAVDHPFAEERAYFTVARVSRDLANQSSVGFIFTDREFQDSYNRVGGVDGRWKITRNWVASGQAVTSATRFLDGSHIAGPAYYADLKHSGEHLTATTTYQDRSPGFFTEAGFVNRTDLRRIRQTVFYQFRPSTKFIDWWGPFVFVGRTWDHEGLRLDQDFNAELDFQFARQTNATVFSFSGRERLRPQDFPGLPGNRDFSTRERGMLVSTSFLKQVSLSALYTEGNFINFVPGAGKLPDLADTRRGEFTLTLRPFTPLRIDNTYLLRSLRERESGRNIFNNHIIRSKWNWQFTRELSLRVIAQYDALLANPEPAVTVLETSKRFNIDVLATYLVNPWTAVYVGYNSNLQNLAPGLCGPTVSSCDLNPALLRSDDFINDGKQFFVKVSYLIRF